MSKRDLLDSTAVRVVEPVEADDRVVDERGACALIGGKDYPIHRTTLWRGIQQRRYPAPFKAGPRSNRWFVRELLAVKDAAVARRDADIAERDAQAERVAHESM